MKRNKSFQRISPALCAGLMLMAASSCEKEVVINEEFEIVSPADPAGGVTVEEVTAPTALIGNMGDAETLLRGAFTNIVDADAAKVIVIENESIKDFAETLAEAYKKGALIIVFNPDSMEVSDWSEQNDVFYAGPEQDEECSFYGFNNSGSSYTFHNKLLIDDDDVPLFHLCSWVNSIAGNRLHGVDLRTKDIKKRFSPQNVTHTFKISLDEKQIVDDHWASAGQLALTTTANVTYNIYPIRVFDGNATGEYYAVEAEMVLHNAPMNNGSWTRRRGEELAQICGFYLNSCDVSATLLRKSNGVISESATHSFAEGAAPHPVSTADAATYNPGFEWNLDATVCGGIPDAKDNFKLTSFNSWTWNNTETIELPGVGIKNIGNTANVGFTLAVNGLPGETDNLTVTPVPDIATGDITFRYSWIWRVSDVEDTSNDRFYMQVGINPIYQAYQWITEGKMTIGEFGNVLPESKSTFRFPLTPPNRMATGSAVIRNSAEESYYISDIRLWRNKSTDQEPDFTIPQTISTPSATGGSGVSATMLILPAGDYTVMGVRYSIEDGARKDEHIIVNTKPITLSVAGNVVIDFGSDNFTIR